MIDHTLEEMWWGPRKEENNATAIASDGIPEGIKFDSLTRGLHKQTLWKNDGCQGSLSVATARVDD